MANKFRIIALNASKDAKVCQDTINKACATYYAIIKHILKYVSVF